MTMKMARSAAAWLGLWCGLVAFSVVCWIGLFYFGAWLVSLWGVWPIVRFAATLVLVGVVMFVLSEQMAEVYARDMERRR